MDPVSRLCAIDAVFILTYRLKDLGTHITQEVLSAVEKIGEEVSRAVNSLSSIFLHESVLLCRTLSILESLVECHYYWEIICTSCLPAMCPILSPDIHLQVVNIDSVFIVTRLLVILQKLCFFASTAKIISSELPLVHSLAQLLLTGNSIATTQNVISRCLKWKNLVLPYSGNTIQTLAVLCLDYLSLFNECRVELIESRICETLFQCLYQMEYTRYTTSTSDEKDSLETELQLVPIEKLKIKSSTNAKSSYDVISTLLVDILYNLSCVSSDCLYQSLFQVADTTISHVLMNCLLTLWSSSFDNISRKILAIMIRCGVGKVDGTAEASTSTSTLVKNKLSCDPWLTLITTEQIAFLCDILTFQQDSPDKTPWKMDQLSLSFAQRIACSSLFWLVSNNQQCKAAFITLCELESCDSNPNLNFFLRLESFCRQYQEAMLLMSEIFRWPEIHYKYCSSGFLHLMLQVLSAQDIVARCAVVRIFGSGILHNEESKKKTLNGIFLNPPLAQYFEEVLLVCLETVLTMTSPDYIVTQQSSNVEGYLTEVRENNLPIFPGETVVNAIAIIAALLQSRRNSNNQPSFDPMYTTLSDLPLNSSQEISLQTSCCRAVLAVLETSKDLVDGSDPIVQAMWEALLLLSSWKQSAEVLLVNGVVDVMKNWIHSLVSMKIEQRGATHQSRDLLLCAFQVLRCILIGFEDYSAHLILLNDHILNDLTGYLYNSESTLHTEILIHILHSLSTTTTHSSCLLNSKNLPLDVTLIDWLCKQVIDSLSSTTNPYQSITVSRMISLLSNLSRVEGASEQILSNSSLLQSLSNSLTTELASTPAPQVTGDQSNGTMWTVQQDYSPVVPPTPDTTSLVSVILSLFHSIAPAMYLLSDETSMHVLPSDLLNTFLIIAGESTNILHIDQVDY